MAQFDKPAAQAVTKTTASHAPDRNAPRSGLLPMVGVLAAAAFVANAWFFYHQGQRDAANPATTQAPAAPAEQSSPAAPSDKAAMPRTTRQLATETAMASADAAVPAKPDYVLVVHPQAKAKAANPRAVAKATQPPTAGREPGERRVALIARTNPAYPLQALRANEQGTVLVLAQVDVDGRVSDTRVVHHSGSSTLDRAATSEVRRWKFEPAIHNGRPVMASIEVPVNYRLGE